MTSSGWEMYVLMLTWFIENLIYMLKGNFYFKLIFQFFYHDEKNKEGGPLLLEPLIIKEHLLFCHQVQFHNDDFWNKCELSNSLPWLHMCWNIVDKKEIIDSHTCYIWYFITILIWSPKSFFFISGILNLLFLSSCRLPP